MDISTWVITDENIDDIFKNPQNYTDCSFDLPLIEILGECRRFFTVLIGITEDEIPYITLKDDKTSEDFYQKNNESLWIVYETAIDKWLRSLKSNFIFTQG